MVSLGQRFMRNWKAVVSNYSRTSWSCSPIFAPILSFALLPKLNMNRWQLAKVYRNSGGGNSDDIIRNRRPSMTVEFFCSFCKNVYSNILYLFSQATWREIEIQELHSAETNVVHLSIQREPSNSNLTAPSC